jgi:hypothetical protein
MNPTRLRGKKKVMTDSSDLPVNHHADHPAFAGLVGWVVGVQMLITGGLERASRSTRRR